ncbi:MAG TPA: tetratricopeptide repeat protein [Steroidobacteraceae bacterium]|nr:tetratricopeptide repeat protein [Steroidobacteraceae bacterium]
MAEGLIGGMLGDEDEKPEVEAADALAGAEAFASAVAAKLAGSDPNVARKTEIFLDKQAQILETQNEHLKSEHSLRIKHLRNQLAEGNVRRFGLRLRVGFQLFLVLFATVIGIGVAVMIYDAINSRSVVVDSFDAPPALVTRGVTGTVVAGGLLDELRRLQSATRADAAKRELANAWAGEIKLAVPEAGISLGEFSRILKARFGHDLHIQGEVIQVEAGGLALTVRGDEVAAKTFTGKSVDLDDLITQAAGYVYSQSEPVLWAYYLTNKGRSEEALAFSKAAYAGAGKADRPYLLNTWANALSIVGGSPNEALKLYRAALKLKPDYWVEYNNVMQSYWLLGEEESAWKEGEAMRVVAGGRPGRAPETYYQNSDILTWNLGPWLDETVADADASGGIGSNVGGVAAVNIADIDMRLHDPAAAEMSLQTIKTDPADHITTAIVHFVRGRLATEAGDAAASVAEMEAFQAIYADPVVSSQYAGYLCWVAPAEAAAGRPEKAEFVFKTAGRYVDCYRFHGDFLDDRGDWTAAQKAYEEAVALAPDLPAAYYSWGVALAKHGDFTGAEAKLKDANQRGQHWADPLKVWGDVLMKQGKTKAALAKYDEALKYAPNWEQLKEARETLGKQKT